MFKNQERNTTNECDYHISFTYKAAFCLACMQRKMFRQTKWTYCSVAHYSYSSWEFITSDD